MRITHFSSPLGTLEIREEQDFIVRVNFIDEEPSITDSHRVLQNCITQLQEYFVGQRKSFKLPLAPHGTPFQQKVWEELQRVQFGKTSSYIDLAKKLGDSKLTRAVGSANGKNPIAIIIPCHRIVGSDGSLTGYVGGLKKKKWLLEHESAQASLF